MNDDIIISAKGLGKEYADLKAVDNFSFELKKSEFLGILGPNGAGKTTIIKMLYNLVSRSQGKLEVFGMDPFRNEDVIKMKMGIVPQDDNLDTDMTVLENLEIYAGYFGLDRAEISVRISYLLKLFELEGRENHEVKTLSGGMKRRLVIIRSLINDPLLILLDEPTIGLDPQVRHLIWEKLSVLKKEGLSVILTTHYMDEAEKLCDRLLIMDKGKLIKEGSTEDLLMKLERHVLETKETLNKDDIFTEKIRLEKSGGRNFLFSDNEDLLLEIKRKIRGKSLLRPSSLEDLFLDLTGRIIDE